MKRIRRNVLKFRDFEIDEDDYHVLTSMLNTKGNLEDDAYYRTVARAIKGGAVEVNEQDNADKRVTYFGLKEFQNGKNQSLAILLIPRFWSEN